MRAVLSLWGVWGPKNNTNESIGISFPQRDPKRAFSAGLATSTR